MEGGDRAERLKGHPDRIEARLLTVVTRAGRTYSYIHHRISGHTELFDSQVTTSGAIPELMADLLTETIK